jgi:hypothetical protein
MIITGVEVGRGVAVGLGVVVGAGVQVGSIRTRGVAVGGTSVGEEIGVGVEVEAGVQAARNKRMPRKIKGNRLMIRLPFSNGSTQHS